MEKEYDFSNARKQPLFSFETDYDMNTFMAMARALRMTVRKKHSKRSLVFGLGVAAFGVASIIMWGTEAADDSGNRSYPIGAPFSGQAKCLVCDETYAKRNGKSAIRLL